MKFYRATKTYPSPHTENFPALSYKFNKCAVLILNFLSSFAGAYAAECCWKKKTHILLIARSLSV